MAGSVASSEQGGDERRMAESEWFVVRPRVLAPMDHELMNQTKQKLRRRRPMKAAKALVGVCLGLAVASLVFGGESKSKDDALTGTWNCVAHLSGESDIPFTMKLEQA